MCKTAFVIIFLRFISFISFREQDEVYVNSLRWSALLGLKHVSRPLYHCATDAYCSCIYISVTLSYLSHHIGEMQLRKVMFYCIPDQWVLHSTLLLHVRMHADVNSLCLIACFGLRGRIFLVHVQRLKNNEQLYFMW